AGKSLVGLLAAQSLVNELERHVLYVCSSIQLVEQTAEKASGYGLEVTTYFRQEASNDLYQRAQAPCLTTYQAVFNGFSRFRRDDVGGLIFDDAHAASHLIRDQFTLRIGRDDPPNLFEQVSALFRQYHVSVGYGVGYDETVGGGDNRRTWFIPPGVVR